MYLIVPTYHCDTHLNIGFNGYKDKIVNFVKIMFYASIHIIQKNQINNEYSLVIK